MRSIGDLPGLKSNRFADIAREGAREKFLDSQLEILDKNQDCDILLSIFGRYYL